MRRIKTAALVVVAATGILVASGAALASATVPEFGRCVKAVGRTGEYGGANCVAVSATHKGTYNWVPGPGPKAAFSSVGEKIALETVGDKRKIECGGAFYDGEYTGPKAENVTVTLVGCVDQAKRACSTNAAKGKGEIEGAEEGELGFVVGGEKPKVGIDLKPKSPSNSVFSFTCGEPPETPVIVNVTGSVIGAPLTPIDKMTSEFKLAFKAPGGKQVPQQFEGGAKDTLTAEFTQGTETTTEEIGLRVLYLTENEEPIEIKAK